MLVPDVSIVKQQGSGDRYDVLQRRESILQ